MQLRSIITVAVVSTAFLPMIAQDAVKPKNTVVYVAEQQSVAAGKKSTVDLHFRVVDGYHVNSHTPKSEFLIPTALKTEPLGGVTQGTPIYSTGQEFSFSFSPTEKLDVYSGEFTIKLPVTADAGEHTVAATLHYQACDHAACYPPKSLPLQVLFTAK
ncbi:protein-disulfide reductase DsbD N-terminal domain-containing protein [Granulicella arctica]|uniref:protein-disulfide reductase DsbD N-terminal domain-containing protein n=1 Tax=Granulicella arctica TaxID=940613 RepID=UPI0021DFE053|nr:protein-disulfide reductase DsbD N-terminal domain-containing protein [Granulicella arctica]